ncbi:MAG: quinone oxidoreductase [Acidimicrobiia bacterium]|nr:quinone oxidoreductase [Acidimicrobiia bacterium]
MQAISVHEPGDADKLVWNEVADPTPGAGQLLVSVVAAGVNYIDTYHRRGIYPLGTPFTPGLEGSGIVEAVGDGVTDFAPGDRVAWTDQLGSYAEKVAINADRAVLVPADFSLMNAAAMMLQGVTAHYLATDTFHLESGHRCLIHAGAGGVGRLLIQLARRAGAEVFTTVSSPEKAALASAAGATHVINYEDQDFVEAVEQIAGDRSLDVVYDGVGAATFEKGLMLLKPRGLMALFGQSSGVVPPFDLGALARLGSLYITRPTMGSYIATRSEFQARCDALFSLIENGELELTIDRTMPLSEAAAAHRALEGRETAGKVLLVP